MSDTIAGALGSYDKKIGETSMVSGVLPAIVTNLKDPEKLGRIKVNYPWLDDNSETDWVRVLTFYGGSSHGALFLPEVGDEVLVAYQKGNINAPYVLGSLYSKKGTPPDENADGKNNIKIFKSRCGHTMTFDDTDSKEKFEIKSKSGHVITLDDASGSEKLSIIDKTGSNSIVIESSSNAITIKSSQNITIQGGMDISIKGTNINVEASAQLNLKGAMIKAEASGITQVKGSMVQIN